MARVFAFDGGWLRTNPMFRRSAPRAGVALAIVTAFLAVAAVPGVARAQDPKTEAQKLEDQYFAAAQARDYAKAIEIGLKLVEMAPRGGKAAYNVACAYVLSGDRAKGLEYLKRAVADGFAEIDQIANDADLVTLQNDFEFKAIVQEVRNNKQKQIDDFRKKVEAAKPIVYSPPKVDSSRPMPLLIALHGDGENAEDIADAYRNVAAEFGVLLVAPRAVVEAPQKGFTWETAAGADFIVLRTIEALVKQYKIDERRIVLSGYSEGGLMAYQLAMRNPRRYVAVIPIAAPCYQVTIPSTPLLPKLYALIGDKDAAYEQNRQFASILSDKGAAVQLAVLAGQGHAMPKERDAELRKALTFALGAPVNPPTAASGPTSAPTSGPATSRPTADKK